MDYSKFVNKRALKREPSLIRELTKMRAEKSKTNPDIIFMAGGFPNPDSFPISKLSIQVDADTEFALEGSQIREALQYQPTLGYPPLVEELKKLLYRTHKPPNWDNSDIIVTIGSQQGLSGICDLILEDGDPVVVPQPLYSSCLSVMHAYNPTYLQIPEDSEGMQPDRLRSVLDKWNSSHELKPKIMYLNPTGCNPTGRNIPTHRKKEIYQIAREHNLLILEDDPYYWLHFLKEDPTSFLSMDVDGRVIRLDSFSKIFSSGMRVGFCVGPKQIIRYLELSTQHSYLHCSSLSQVVVHRILEQWGSEGFTEHTNKVKDLYRKRRDLMTTAAEKYLQGLAEWEIPLGGMFLWLRCPGLEDTYKIIMENGLQQGIMLLPGNEFMVDKKKPCSYIRCSYSLASASDIDKGMERLANLIRDEMQRQAGN